MVTPCEKGFIVDGWQVSPAEGVIARGEVTEHLEPKVMDVLVYFASRPGEVITREELEREVWRGALVGYDAVTATVIKLRKALQDNAKKPRIIATIPKKGYQLVASIEFNVAPDEAAGSAISDEPLPSTSKPTRLWWAWAALTAFFVLGAGLLVYLSDNEPVSVTTAVPDDSVRVVVLPFTNLSGDPGQDYFSNGLTDDLITELSGLPGLAVIAYNSASVYRNNDSLVKLRNELKIQFVLKGSVRRDAGRLRVNAQLIDAAGGQHLWAERYEEKAQDMFAVQDALVARIATSLNVSVRSNKAGVLRERYAASIEAYDHFLRGKDEYGRRAQDDLHAANTSFEKAITLDPKFARAYAALALVYLRDIMDAWTDEPSHSMVLAHTLVRQAIELDDALPEAHYVNAFVALFERRYQDAVAELDSAIDLRPSYADAHAALAWVLHFAGRPDAGREHLTTASRLNPHVIASYLMVDGGIAFTLGRTEDAIATLKQAQAMSPTHPRIYLWLAAAQAHAGQLEEAKWTIEELRVMHPSITLSRLRDAFPFKDPASLEQLVSALRMAGLPE